MKKFDYNLFFTEHSLEEYKEYYSTHTSLQTSKYFNISLRTIKQINRLYKVPTKLTTNLLITKLNKVEFEQYYRTHSNQEVFDKYNIDLNKLYKIKKVLKIKSRTIEEQKAINLRLYNAEFTGQRKEVIYKINESKKINHTFNTSKPEEVFYDLLLTKFKREDIVRQYNTKIYENSDRYPFNCDFYIRSLDLFIELNFSWTHGKHKFNKNNKEDLAKLTVWKSKDTKFYKHAIEVWTIKDIEKFKIAEINKLNYLVFYTLEEAINYLSKL